MKTPPIETLKAELATLSKYEILIFGSFVEGGFGPNSDIDIAIISRSKNPEKNNDILNQFLGRFPKKYDINIFELLPIRVKYSILCNYKVLFGDRIEISEYLYEYRKIWNDCKYRILENQFESIKERREILQNKHI